MAEGFANTTGAIGTLTGILAPGVTTLPASGAAPAKLVAAVSFRIIVDKEIMLVTSGAGTTSWKVTRKQEETAEVSHASGAEIYHKLTAGGVLTLVASAVPLVEVIDTKTATTAEITLAEAAAVQISILTLKSSPKIVMPKPIAGMSFSLYLKQDAVGSRTVTWEVTGGGKVRWEGGTAPTLTTAVNAVDSASFTCVDGVNWDGGWGPANLL